jgi:hypothetical protein
LYRRLKLRQIELDEKIVTFGLKSCTELRNLLLGKGMHADSLKLGLNRDNFVGSSLVRLYYSGWMIWRRHLKSFWTRKLFLTPQ